MSTDLPAGYTTRRPTLDDVDAILDVITAHNVPVIGTANYLAHEIADEFVEPGFDPATDGWLVQDPGGRVAGYGWAYRKGSSDNVDVAFWVRPGDSGAAGWLFDTVRARALELAAEQGHPQVVQDIEVYRGDGTRRGLAERAGFAAAATFNRLRIDHAGPRPQPALPAGVRVGHGTDEPVRRDGHALWVEGFTGHFGFVADDYPDWIERQQARSDFSWELLHVAYVEDVPAAMILRGDNYIPDEKCGYVRTVATAPRFRGRGLARLLLGYAFAADAARGLGGTLLHVDTDPTRPALGVYLSVGMRPDMVVDIYRRTVPTVPGPAGP